MGAHETVEGTLAAVETDAIRHRAAQLVALFELAVGLDPVARQHWSRADWVEWEGWAYAALKELARG